jgi:uncharacterized protein (DUF1697 family)
VPVRSKHYVAFLRGVSPLNAKMPELKRAFELAGFTEVRTLLTSGNVVFSARPAPDAALARQAEAAMRQHLERPFLTFVRSVDSLRALLASDPYAAFSAKRGFKRVVTFLASPPRTKPALPLEIDGGRILALKAREVFGDYRERDRGPAFMTLLQKTFGKNITTRTWQTVERAAR